MSKHLACHFKIRWLIHRPTQTRQIIFISHSSRTEAAGLADIRGDMLMIVGTITLLCRAHKCLHSHYFNIQAIRVGGGADIAEIIDIG